MSDIKTCISAFNALYAAPLSAPSSARVTDFLDASFSHGQMTQAGFATAFSSGGSQVVEGFKLEVAGFTPKDMSPFSAGEISQIDTSNNNANFGSSQRSIFNNRTSTAYDGANGVAWIKIKATGDAGVWSMKMIKGAAYSGCPGGWRMGGSLRPDSHMNARIARNADDSYTRAWPFHITKAEAIAAGGANVFLTVRGPGLVVYSGDANNPVGASTRLKLAQNASAAVMVLADGQAYYGTRSDALESCQDLAALNAPPAAGTPCIDETQTAPGKIYLWTVMSNSTTVASVFPFQTNAVPMSKTFARANTDKIFATFGSVIPSSASALNGLQGSPLTGLITFNYTQSAAYGSKMDHCGIVVHTSLMNDALNAEQPAAGQETTCTFNAPQSVASNYNSNQFGFNGTVTAVYVRLVTATLGNQATYSRQLQ